MRQWLRRTLFVLLASLSLWLSAELLFLNAVILPTLRGLLAAAYRGQAPALVNIVFEQAATDAYKTPLALYQDKLAYGYEAAKLPTLVVVIGATVLLWLSTRPREAKLAIRTWPQRMAYVVFCMLLLAVLVHAQLGTYSRYMADDYCTAADLAARGALGNTVRTYLTWTGRYSSVFFSGLALRHIPHLFPLYPALILLAWFAAATLALFQFPFAQRRMPRICLSALLAATLVFTTLQGSPDKVQSLYWFSAMPNLLPPLALSAACVGLAGYRLTHKAPAGTSLMWGVSVAAVSFVAGGFCETYSALQVSAWAVFLIMAFVTGRSRFRSRVLPATVPFLLGSLAALAVLAAAPGNSVRMGVVGRHPALLSTLEIAWASSLEFLWWSFSSGQRGLSLLALLLLSALISGGLFEGSVRPMEARYLKWRALILLPAAILVLLYACFMPVAYGLGGPLPGRDQIIPAFVLVCGVACEGIIIGQLAHQKSRQPGQVSLRSLFSPMAACTLVLCLLTTVQATYAQLRRLPEFALYASMWDANDMQIRSARARGADQVVIARIPFNWAGMADREINNDPGNWVNVCASRYYGIEITSEGPSYE